MEPTTLFAVILGAAALIAACGVIAKFGARVYRGIKKMEFVYDEATRNPEDRAKMDAFIGDMNTFKDDALHQLYPNSGGSMNDKVTRIENLLGAHIADLGIHSGTAPADNSPGE